MGYMTLQVELDNDVYVELTGSNVVVWQGTGEPTYSGPIETMDAQILAQLLAKGVIRKTA